MSRQSLLPKKIIRFCGPKMEVTFTCIGCRRSIGALHAMGSVIAGMGFSTIKSVETSPVTAVIESYDRSYVIGGDTTETSKRVAFYRRDKGPICPDCAADSRVITDSSGKRHPVIKVDTPWRRPADEKHYRHETSVDDLPDLKRGSDAEKVHIGSFEHFNRLSGKHGDRVLDSRTDSSKGSFGSDYIGRTK